MMNSTSCFAVDNIVAHILQFESDIYFLVTLRATCKTFDRLIMGTVLQNYAKRELGQSFSAETVIDYLKNQPITLDNFNFQILIADRPDIEFTIPNQRFLSEFGTEAYSNTTTREVLDHFRKNKRGVVRLVCTFHNMISNKLKNKWKVSKLNSNLQIR